MKPRLPGLISSSFALFGFALAVSVQAQELNDGKFGSASQGRIDLFLEVNNRPNPLLQLITPGGSVIGVPAFLEESLSNALGEKRNIEFPVCLGGLIDSSAKVDVESEGLLLSGQSGQDIPYKARIERNLEARTDGSVRANSEVRASCDESSALLVHVAIPQNLPASVVKALRGSFKLTLTSE